MNETDGTTSSMDNQNSDFGIDPAFEALSGKFSEKDNRADFEIDDVKLIAFYLPQYHRIKENSEWWSPGFTEWTNVAGGRPNFDNHYQPHIPRELGFYDLSNVDTIREQADLASTYGVNAFCFYHYWFSGKRVLEKPLENFLASDIDFNFCICWANENWTKTWDGDEKNILLEQLYKDSDAEDFFYSILPILQDARYITVGGVPLLVVYRAKHLPMPNEWFGRWKDLAKQNGLQGLHISVVDFYDIENPDEVGADSLVEFPPHKFNGPQNIPDHVPDLTNPSFSGGMVDYTKMALQSSRRETPSFKLFRGIIPSWDNTARRQNTPTIIVNNHPKTFGAWLSMLRRWTVSENSNSDERIVFINAWNEWGEGCHLEPDLKYGLEYLEECYKSGIIESGCDSLSKTEIRDKFVEELTELNRPSSIFSNYTHSSIDSQTIEPAMPFKEMVEKNNAQRMPSSFTMKIAYKLTKYPRIKSMLKKLYLLLNR